jgi:hypothetical protein
LAQQNIIEWAHRAGFCLKFLVFCSTMGVLIRPVLVLNPGVGADDTV